ncbi:cob(I)yrinic acid a,c-diamide adenosyltransferase [Paludibacterium purpuratum]|uniref:cob(I)yrinic acid a,c-diamide adenosyltransferase n=1 Tax=Paludibacterium purpuratum TaxID=1144873 RepID=UPI003C7CD05E
MSRIVTRTGDGGTTGLGDGSRVSKDALRIHALGEVDELNCLVGVLMAESLPDDVTGWLTEIQHDLFDLGSEIAVPGFSALSEPRVLTLEAWVEDINRELPMLKEFILPGGTRAAALAHQARAVCRRAERTVVGLAETSEVSVSARQYLNRLSDFLFVLARHLNRLSDRPDILWRPRRTD